jgi:hypothetical protein
LNLSTSSLPSRIYWIPSNKKTEQEEASLVSTRLFPFTASFTSRTLSPSKKTRVRTAASEIYREPGVLLVVAARVDRKMFRLLETPSAAGPLMLEIADSTAGVLFYFSISYVTIPYIRKARK